MLPDPCDRLAFGLKALGGQHGRLILQAEPVHGGPEGQIGFPQAVGGEVLDQAAVDRLEKPLGA